MPDILKKIIDIATGGTVSSIIDIVGKVTGLTGQPLTELEVELEKAVAAENAKIVVGLTAYMTESVKQGGETIRAEIASDSWLGKNWRPIIMMLLGTVVLFQYIIAPVGGIAVLPLPAQILTLLTIGIGGYQGMRSVEKIAPSFFAAKYKDR